MTGQHTPARAPDLTAKDWGLILAALGAYQHHAAYRDLHGKVALLAEAAVCPSRAAGSLAAAVSDATGAQRLDRSAVMG